MVVVIGRIGAILPAAGQAAVTGTADQVIGQGITVRVSAGQVNTQGRVLVGGPGLTMGRGRVVDGIDCDGHCGDIAVCCAVVGLVGKGIRAGQAGSGRVVERAVAVPHHHTATGEADVGHLQEIAVRVRVVVEHTLLARLHIQVAALINAVVVVIHCHRRVIQQIIPEVFAGQGYKLIPNLIPAVYAI